MPKLAKKVVTQAMLDGVRKPRSGRKEIPDGVVRGLMFRVSSANVRSYVLSYRKSGKLTRRVIGYHPETSLAEVRRLAEEIKTGADAGILLGRLETVEPDGLTFEELAEAYIKRGLVRRTGPNAGQPLRSAGEMERIIRKELIPVWGDRLVHDLTKKDGTALTDAIVDRGSPYTANNVHGVYHRVMNWAVKRGDLDANPFALMDKPVPKVQRDRVLSANEMKAVWDACYPMGYPFGPLFRLLLLTGQREREVSDMTWGELDLDAKLWAIPGERAKNGLPHEVPLSTSAMQEIGTLPRFTGQYVFTTQDGARPVSGFSKAKARIDRYSGVTGWRIHDLRRTIRTGMAELGVPEIVAERVLNHSEQNVLVRTYNRHHYTEEKRDALERWAGHVRDLVSPPPENVVKMEAGR
jgi:integrase